MSEPIIFGTQPQGRRLDASTSAQPFGEVLRRADERVLAWAREHSSELTEDDVDFTRSAHEVFAKDGSRYWPLYPGAVETAVSAGVDSFLVRDGRLVMLRPPNSGRVTSVEIGKGIRARKLGPDEPLGTMSSWR